MLYFNCLPDVLRLGVLGFFLNKLWVGLWCVIVAFPGHTHLHFEYYLITKTKKSRSSGVMTYLGQTIRKLAFVIWRQQSGRYTAHILNHHLLFANICSKAC